MRVIAILLAFVGCYRDAAPTTPVAPHGPGKPAAPIANNDPLAYLPETSEVVVVIDAKAVRASAAWKTIELVLRPRIEALLAEFVKSCNFDPISQLRGVAIGLRDVKAAQPSGVFVLRGYSRDLVMKCVEATRQRDPRKITIERGVITVPDQAAFTFVDETTLVSLLGTGANAQQLAAVIDGGAPLRMASGFVDLSAKVEHSQAWAVIRDANMLRSAAALGAQPGGMMVGFNLHDDLQGQVRMRFAEPDQVTAAVALVQGQLSQINSMFPGVTVDADDIDAVLHVQLDQPQLDMVVRMFVH